MVMVRLAPAGPVGAAGDLGVELIIVADDSWLVVAGLLATLTNGDHAGAKLGPHTNGGRRGRQHGDQRTAQFARAGVAGVAR